MYDAYDKKTLDLPDVYTLENHEDYATFSHADVVGSTHQQVASELDLPPDSLHFLSEVSTRFRHAYKFSIHASFDPDKLARRRRSDKIYIYDPSCLYPMGWIGYGDFSIGRDQGPKYTVCSLHIVNMRFDCRRDQHRMLVTENMNVAVKNALKYLQPVTHKDVLVNTFDATESKISRLEASIKGDLRGKIATLGIDIHVRGGEQPQIWQELCHLLDCEHAFISDEFRDTIIAARNGLEELDVNERKVVDLYCVRVYERSGKQFYDVIPVNDATRVNGIGLYNRASQALREHKVVRLDNDTIPEDIYSKMTVLSICDKGEFVEDVGHRNQDTVYYVYR